jgi:hypothetical protein
VKRGRRATQWTPNAAKMDIKKPTKTHQAKIVDYVVLELSVLPRHNYSIKTTYVVAASRLFMLLATE